MVICYRSHRKLIEPATHTHQKNKQTKKTQKKKKVLIVHEKESSIVPYDSNTGEGFKLLAPYGRYSQRNVGAGERPEMLT